MPRVDKILLPWEDALERFIAANLNQISGFEGLILVKTQYEVPGGLIDILARDPDGTLVVVELKRARADRGVVAQTVQYMSQLAASPHAAGHRVCGLIITGLADPQLQRYATRLTYAEGFQLDWLLYEVAMTVTPTDPTGLNPPGEADVAGPDLDPDAEALCLVRE